MPAAGGQLLRELLRPLPHDPPRELQREEADDRVAFVHDAHDPRLTDRKTERAALRLAALSKKASPGSSAGGSRSGTVDEDVHHGCFHAEQFSPRRDPRFTQRLRRSRRAWLAVRDMDRAAQRNKA